MSHLSKAFISAFMLSAVLAAPNPGIQIPQPLDSGRGYSAGSDTRLIVFAYDPNVVYTILSRPLSVTHIQLGEDETIKSVWGGDKIQWNIEAEDGGRNIFIKPIRSDLVTSLTVITNRRNYQLTLRSNTESGRWYQRVSWQTPDLAIYRATTNESIVSKVSQEEERLESLSAGEVGVKSPDQLNFNYRLSGDADFRPEQVFDDGRFVWIRIPQTQELPAVFLLNKKGDLEVINFVKKGDFLIVQRLADQLALVLDKEKVVIKRTGGSVNVNSRGN